MPLPDHRIAARKAQLREEAAGRVRQATAQQRRQWDAAIQQRLLAHPFYLEAQQIHCYLALPDEVATEPIVRVALSGRKQVAAPVVEGEALRFARIEDYDRDLAPGYRGILEPKPEGRRWVDPGRIDLFIIPGVAFDPRGYRLGRGLGYYDRCLAGVEPSAKVCALAYELQLFDLLPTEAHDVQVDLIMTETRTIETGEHDGADY